MSYILEALRRAESERERKRGVPGLHAQPVPAISPDDQREGRSRPWLWVVIGLSAGVVLMLLWRSWATEPLIDEAALARAPVAGNVTPQDSAAAGVAPSAAPTPAPAAAPSAAQQPAAPQPSTQGPGKAGAAAAEKPTPMPSKHAPAAHNPTARAGTPRGGAATSDPVSPQSPRAAASGATAAPLPAPAGPEPRLRTLAELPDDLRRSVPALAFGGSVYSDTPAQRMVIFNGQVLREGEAVTDDLLLEQIRPRSAVLRLRGQRFEMAF